MKKGLGKLGIIVILVGFFFILNSSFAIITGNVVSKKVDALDSFIGIMFLISGLALFLVSELESRILEKKSLAERIKKSGAVITSVKKLKKIALESGYYLGKEVKEGTSVFDEKGNYITVIPKGREVSRGVYYNIIKALATGESSYKKGRQYLNR